MGGRGHPPAVVLIGTGGRLKGRKGKQKTLGKITALEKEGGKGHQRTEQEV